MVISERQFSSKPATHDIGFNTRGNDACCPPDTDVDTGAEGAVAHVRLHISLVSLESRSARSPTAYLPYKCQDHTTKDGRGSAGGARVTYDLVQSHLSLFLSARLALTLCGRPPVTHLPLAARRVPINDAYLLNSRLSLPSARRALSAARLAHALAAVLSPTERQ